MVPPFAVRLASSVLAVATSTHTEVMSVALLLKVTSCTFTSPRSSYLSSKALMACLARARRDRPDTPDGSAMLPETSSTISRLESISTAATERSVATALGTSSTMFTTMVLVLLLPSASVAL
ncbi:hypothetical protein D3C79_842430 [compost metagenome]